MKKRRASYTVLTSLSLLATTLPAEPPPTTIKSYSLSGIILDTGRPHGSSMSHWDLMKTSNKPMNNMNADPPHVLANVGPGWVTGQLQPKLLIVEQSKESETIRTGLKVEKPREKVCTTSNKK